MAINTTWNPAMDAGFTSVNTIFDGSTYFGTEWLVPLLVVGVSMLLVTRDVREWKSLALPMCTLWLLIGLDVGILIFATSAIFFAVDVFSTKLLGQVMRVTVDASTQLNPFGKKLEREVARARKDTRQSRALFEKEQKGLTFRSERARKGSAVLDYNKKVRTNKARLAKIANNAEQAQKLVEQQKQKLLRLGK